MNDAEQELLETFYDETRENLEICEESLLELEKDPGNTQLIDTVFRAMHTIKGGSGLVGASAVQELAHKLENILSDLRDQSSKIEEDTLSLLLSGTGMISNILDTGNLELDQNQYENEINDLLTKIDNIEGQNSSVTDSVDVNSSDSVQNDTDNDNYRYYLVRLNFNQDVFETGTDPIMFFNELEEHGEILQTYINKSSLPNDLDQFKNFDPQKMKLGWTVFLKSKSDQQEIEDVFMFVIDDNDIIVEDISSQISSWFMDGSSIKDNFRKYEIVSDDELEWAAEKQLNLPGQYNINQKSEEEKEEKDEETNENKESMKSQPEKSSDYKTVEKNNTGIKSGQDTIRVNTSKLEGILNNIAELMIAQSRVKELVGQMTDKDSAIYDEVINSFQEVDKIVRQVQDEVMEASMVPIGSTLLRFQKMARELAQENGKKVQVDISGKETELDKKVIEQISDPLKHLIRNSMDHGLESPEEREQQGKSAVGQLNISAYHQEGSIIIQLSDDGRGINHDKVLARAVEKGLASQDKEYSREEIIDMLFLPGFSTAAEVSDISGRGVGLDVVKNNIKNLRGNIEVDSAPGEGTSFVIKLPLTLAIIDGMMVRMGQEKFIIPITFISEFIKPRKKDFSRAEGKGTLLSLRDEYIPYARLDELVNLGESSQRFNSLDEGICIILNAERRKLALMVDEIIGQEQVVIKSLRENLTHIEGIAGVTILGEGRVSIILDVPSLLKLLRNRKTILEGSNAM